MTNGDVTQRFTGRVDDYVKYRPGYPPRVIQHLIDQGLAHDSDVADVGSGTGILTELLLRHVRRVYAVEPNDAMRAAAETRLGGRDTFISVKATAEATTLPDSSVDMVVAAQALHWFQPDRALREFRRILRPPRHMALVWNERLSDTPFLRAYEAVLQAHGTDYREVKHQEADEEELSVHFAEAFQMWSFDNQQFLDLEGVKGRLFSSSYTPTPGDPRYEPMVQGIEAAFRHHSIHGKVTIRYKTRVYSGLI
jgi:ubiquinone/menaquinone biosynthesis C-methylase UbiE